MILKAKFGKYLLGFADLNKSKFSLLQEEVTEIESIDFVECYPTPLTNHIYAVTIISIEFSLHINIFISAKASF